jgi:zinc transport system substrate-binding protein
VSRSRPALAAVVLLAAAGAALCGCGDAKQEGEGASRPAAAAGEAAAPAAPPLAVFVDSYPLAFFARRIGGDRVAVDFPAPPEVDPALWRPDAGTIARYQQADVILINGGGYAHWIDTAALPSSRVIDTSAAFADRLLASTGAVTHSHGGAGEHSHAGRATCWWLDPALAAEQAGAVAAAFAQARPHERAAFDRGLAALRSDLAAIDTRLEALATRIGSTPLLFSHPVYDYLIRRYGLVARSLDWEPTEAPSAAGWARLDHELEHHPARILVWEAAPVAEAAAELERRGIRSVVFAPLERAPAAGDYVSAMNDNVARLEAAFSPTGAPPASSTTSR